MTTSDCASKIVFDVQVFASFGAVSFTPCTRNVNQPHRHLADLPIHARGRRRHRRGKSQLSPSLHRSLGRRVLERRQMLDRP